ncbi:MAG: sugar transferase [Pseudomonadota bacterium]
MVFRVLDFLLAALGLIVLSPLLLVAILAIWLQDFHSPFYIAERVGRSNRPFRMVKLRSMTIGADKTGVTSTSAGDSRITIVGKIVRKLKLDEVPQFWNVLMGSMSLIGPRPNVVRWGVELYTDEEMRLLSIPPGVSDFSSIVFSDEGQILKDAEDPDLEYNRIIRPWKSRLSLAYVDNRSVRLYVVLIILTVVSAVSRPKALAWIQAELKRIGVDDELVRVAGREGPLVAHPPPGEVEIFSLASSRSEAGSDSADKPNLRSHLNAAES